VLTKSANVETWACEPGASAWLSIEHLADDWWRAHAGRVRCEDDNREAVVEWLDARVLALRSALLPADARERVARWFVEEMRNRYGRSWDETPECQRDDARALASSLLAALGATP